ncbi:MAG: GNAT family N-acetyltransferase [Alphaproteobacteria bacterium]|nr:GNAT family N-acetyltransferase [Alphaproteobacteria bacterium]
MLRSVMTKWQRFEALTAGELYALLRFRQAIFVVEQRSPYADLDGLDEEAWHLLLQAEGALAGYLRLIPAPLRIGRVAVAAPLRRHGLGRRLMGEALSYCRGHYPGGPVALTAQAHLLPFYQSFGFEPTGEPFDDFGLTHVDMTLRPRE